MKVRYCDICLKQILTGSEYIKLIKQKYENKRLIKTDVGDMCYNCYIEKDLN